MNDIINFMPSCEMLQIWPDKWNETRHIAEGLIGQLKEKACQQLLTSDDLEVLNTTLMHVQHVWKKAENEPIVQNGVNVIRSHFAKRFQVDARQAPDVQYRQILERMFARDYFTNSNPEDPEFKSMTILMVHDLRRKESKKHQREISQAASDVVAANTFPRN